MDYLAVLQEMINDLSPELEEGCMFIPIPHKIEGDEITIGLAEVDKRNKDHVKRVFLATVNRG